MRLNVLVITEYPPYPPDAGNRIRTWNLLQRLALRRWYLGIQRRRFEKFESRAMTLAKTVVTVSDADARMARFRFGAANVRIVENGVDTEAFVPSPLKRDPNRILFLGSLDWRPN